MHITITLDTDDKADLEALKRMISDGTVVTPTPAKAEGNGAPAAKAAPAKKAPPKAAPPADTDSDTDDGDEDEAPLSRAIARATALVSSGQAAKVKAALADVGAKRVSELTEKTLPAFLMALDED